MEAWNAASLGVPEVSGVGRVGSGGKGRGVTLEYHFFKAVRTITIGFLLSSCLHTPRVKDSERESNK
jgi:hypothetical protein